MNEDKYDPLNDSKDFYGVTFVTENGSEYTISKEGIFSGRPTIEGAEVASIAGIDPSLFWQLCSTIDNRENFIDKIVREGKRPEKGLCLAIGLTEASSGETGRNGIATSKIVNIIK